MADTERLLGLSSDADVFERELLGSIRDVSPPASAKGETWDALAVQIAAAGALGAAAGKAAGSVAWRAVAAKIAIGVGVAGTTIVGVVALVRHANRPEAVPQQPADVAVAANAPVAAKAPGEVLPVQQDRTAPAAIHRAAPRAGDVMDTPDPLGRESAVVTEARAQLKAGDPRGALATLARLRSGGQNAVLVQEREVIAIQATSALGDTEAARRRARAFVAAYPNSPHTPQLRRIAESP